MSEYYRLIDVDKDNKELRKQLDYYKRKSTRLQQEIKQLKDNWNKLREWLESNWEESQDIWFVKIINKMKELERGVSNE